MPCERIKNPGASASGSAVRSIGLILIALVQGFAAAAGWPRCLQTSSGETVDHTWPHPLSWFIQDPFLRDDGNDFCTSCTDQDKRAVHLTQKARAEVRRIGKLGRFEVYDVFYYFGGEDRIRWKSILVKTAPAEYCEIYHLQPIDALIEPSVLMHAGDVEVLATVSAMPGTGAFSYEAYFQQYRDRVMPIDFSPLGAATLSLLTPGREIRKGVGLDIKSLTYQSFVWKHDDANCCPTGGEVVLHFKIEASHIVVTDKRFDPSAEP